MCGSGGIVYTMMICVWWSSTEEEWFYGGTTKNSDLNNKLRIGPKLQISIRVDPNLQPHS